MCTSPQKKKRIQKNNSKKYRKSEGIRQDLANLRIHNQKSRSVSAKPIKNSNFSSRPKHTEIHNVKYEKQQQIEKSQDDPADITKPRPSQNPQTNNPQIPIDYTKIECWRRRFELPKSVGLCYQNVLLGRGNSSNVWLAKLESAAYLNRVGPSNLIALKKLDPTHINMFRQEVSVMQNLQHKHVLSMFDHSDLFTHGGAESLHIALEYARAGSCKQHLLLISTCPDLIVYFLLQVACGMEYLHENNVIHLDLAARNVLLHAVAEYDGTMTEEMLWRCICKISDFGNALIVGQQTPIKLLPLSSPPEAVIEEYEKRSDAWSFAIFAIELLNGKEYTADVGTPEKKLHFWSMRSRGMHPVIPDCCPEYLRQLLLECLKPKPSKRPTFQVIRAILEQHQV